MDFIEAVKAMSKGNRVRRKYWVEQGINLYFKITHGDYIDAILDRELQKNDTARTSLSQIEATDWEIYKK